MKAIKKNLFVNSSDSEDSVLYPKTLMDCVADESGNLLTDKINSIVNSMLTNSVSIGAINTTLDNMVKVVYKSKFTEKPSDWINYRFVCVSIGDSNFDYAPNPDKLYEVNGERVAWWNVLTFGVSNRTTQIAFYGFNQYKSTDIWYRKQHDNQVTAWRRLLIEKDVDGLSNENLLYNPNFKINQRGQTEYSGNHIYTVDRWMINHGNGKATLNVNDGYVTLTATNIYGAFFQYIENCERLAGKTVTYSIDMEVVSGTVYASISDGTSIHGFNMYGVTSRKTYTQAVTLPDSFNTNKLYFELTAQSSAGAKINVYSVKLEFGSSATPFIPPDEMIELLRCQRYYRAYMSEITKVGGDNYYHLDSYRENKMRVKPTVYVYSTRNGGTLNKVGEWYYQSVVPDITVDNIGVEDNGTHWIHTDKTIPENIPAPVVYVTEDAEIY